MIMTVAAISQVKARLSEYLAKVRAGEEVLITDRGTPVARILPVDRADTALAELERDGLVRAARRPLAPDFLDRPRGSPTGADTLSALLEDRREDR
ncbi:MAG: type II toxin-antitoxin system Phd/YefM family antitoxin [Solirubrobacterales bacterium]